MRPAIVSSRPASLILRAVSSDARHGQRGEIGNRHAVDLHRQTLRTQPVAVADRTLGRRHVVEQVFAVVVGTGRFEILLEMAENSEETGLAAARRLAIEQKVLNLVGKFFERRRQIDAVRFGHQLQSVRQVLRRRARTQAAIEQRLRPIHNDFGGIEIVAAAQAVTLRTRAVRTVERKRARLQLRNADAAIGTGQARGIQRLFTVHDRDQNQAAAQLHRQSDRQFQPVLDTGLHQQAINHDFDGVILALVETEIVFQIDQFAIDARAGEAVLDELFHLFLELAFAAAHDGRHDHDAVVGRERHHALHDLLRRLSRDGLAASRDSAALRSRNRAGAGSRRFR